MTVTTPTWADYIISSLLLHTANQCTKFEDPYIQPFQRYFRGHKNLK